MKKQLIIFATFALLCTSCDAKFSWEGKCGKTENEKTDTTKYEAKTGTYASIVVN